MLSYHQRFQQTDAWHRLIDQMNRQQSQDSPWDSPIYQRWLANYQATATPFNGGNNMDYLSSVGQQWHSAPGGGGWTEAGPNWNQIHGGVQNNQQQQASQMQNAVNTEGSGWYQTGPGGYAFDPNRTTFGMQQAQQRAHQQQLLGGQKLANIADILRKQQSTPPAKPATPGMSGTAPVAPVNYVQNDRLNQGKGWSKFRNQARGTDQFDMINKIVNQYFR